jgi:hypothetical protein
MLTTVNFIHIPLVHNYLFKTEVKIEQLNQPKLPRMALLFICKTLACP